MNKRIIGMSLSLVVFACGATTSAAAAPATARPGQSATTKASGELGELELKRWVERIQADLPKERAQFTHLCGSQIDIDIDCASFGGEKAALERLSGTCARPRSQSCRRARG